MQHLTRLMILLLVLMMLAGCNDNGNGDDDAPEGETPAERAERLVSEAAAELEAATSFELEIAASGEPITFEASGLELRFKKAGGVFLAPDRIRADIEVLLEDVPTEVGFVAIGDEQWLRHDLLTLGQWADEEVVADFNPSSLISEEAGIATALRNLQNPTYVGEDDLDGLPVYHVQGTLDALLARAITFGLIGTDTGQLEVDLYIRQRDNRLEKMVLEEPAVDEETDPTVWDISLYNYSEPVEISEPRN